MGYQLWEAANNEAGRGFTHFAKFDYEGVSDNATSANQVTIATIPAGGAVGKVGAWESTAFAGATDITLDVGTTTGDPDEFINAWDADGGSPTYCAGDAYTSDFHGAISSVSADTDIVAEWNGTTSALTAGEVIIGIEILDLQSWV